MMEQPEPAAASPPTAGRPDRPLGRGLEDVARVFLSGEALDKGIDRSSIRPLKRPLPQEAAARSTVLLRPAQVTRQQVAAALREFEGALEEGLRGLDAEIACPPWGEIDLLAVDRANQLTIIDFDTNTGDEILIRGLSHVAWVVENVPNLRRMFRGRAINFSLKPRLFLLAPQLSARGRRAANQLTGLRVDWVRYLFVESAGRAGIVFERLLPE
jgi:hypothetical protein